LVCVEAYQQTGEDKMAINYADAEDRLAPIPAGMYELKVEVMLGTYGEDNTLMLAKNGCSMHVAFVYTVNKGDYRKRKIWDYVTVAIDESAASRLKPAELNKLHTAVRIGRSKIKQLINSARGLDPDDKSEATDAKRVINSHEDLTGMIFWAEVGERPGSGGYGPSNYIDHILQRGDADYPEAATQARAISPAKSAAANGGAPAESKPPLPPSRIAPAKKDDLDDEVPF
jgi:hypothetical protein